MRRMFVPCVIAFTGACGGGCAVETTPDPSPPPAVVAPAPPAVGATTPPPASSSVPSHGPPVGFAPLPPGLASMPPERTCATPGAIHCWVPIPAGTLHRGAQSTHAEAPGFDPRARPDERPVRDVQVATFWIQQGEVTAADWDGCVAAGVCNVADALRDTAFATAGRPDRAEFPATGVTWTGADSYCRGLGARLPTEAEWEFAARGEAGRRFPWGDGPACPRDASPPGQADDPRVMEACGPVIRALRELIGADQFDTETADIMPRLGADALVEMCTEVAPMTPAQQLSRLRAELAAHPLPARSVPSATEVFPPCAWTEVLREADLRLRTDSGLGSLAGNVAEWTADWYAADAYGAQGAAQPNGPAKGTERVIRGGSFMAEDGFAWRAAARDRLPPDQQEPDVGFRCAWSPR